MYTRLTRAYSQFNLPTSIQ